MKVPEYFVFGCFVIGAIDSWNVGYVLFFILCLCLLFLISRNLCLFESEFPVVIISTFHGLVLDDGMRVHDLD